MAYDYGGGFGAVKDMPLITPSKSPTKAKRAQSMAIGMGGALGVGESSDKGFATPLMPCKKMKKGKGEPDVAV
jgi:hypothetical protein